MNNSKQLSIPKVLIASSINEMNLKAYDLILNSGYRTTNRNAETMGDIFVTYDVNCLMTNSRNRHLNIKGRNSNIFALIGETLWVMSGRDDIEHLSKYIPRAINFSDDGKTWRAAYSRIYNKYQLQSMIDIFKEDGLYTRRATLTIYDPNKDSKVGLIETYGLKNSRDIPCFLPGTEILTNSGYKKIEEISTNDLVFSYNENSECVELKKVQWSGKTDTVKKYIKVTLSNNDIVEMTEDHIVYMKKYSYKGKARQPYEVYTKKAKDLKISDYILSTPIYEKAGEIKKDLRQNKNNKDTNSRSFLKIKNIEVIEKTVDVYDITVQDNHNFILKSGGWIVHNCNQWINFFVSADNKFNMKVIQRSGDAIWGAMSINLTEFSFLHEVVYNSLKDIYPEIELGTYNQSITNFHIYDKTSQQARNALKETQDIFKQNELKIDSPKNIYDVRPFFMKCTVYIENKKTEFEDLKNLFKEYRLKIEDNILFYYVYFSWIYFQCKVQGHKGSNKKEIQHPKEIQEFLDGNSDYSDAIKSSKFRNFTIK